MSLLILGLGTALAEHEITQAEAAHLAGQVCCQTEHEGRLLAVLFRRSGVERRYTVAPSENALNWLPGGSRASTEVISSLGPSIGERMQTFEQHAYPLARRAVERALAAASLNPGEITHLVTVCCTGFAAPGVDVELIIGLGLSPETQRVHVGFMGCHGALNGLRVASALAAADPNARILLCAYELCSLHYRAEWDPEQMIGNALFGDGAAAVTGMHAPPDSAQPWRVEATGSCLLPDSTDAMTWRIRDHGFEMTLSARVPELIREHLRSWLARWLDQHGLAIADVVSWAIHPGGPRIVAAVQQSLGLADAAVAVSLEVLAECGNMSSPTVLFILDRLRRSGAGGPCVALGFGPGLVAEAALIR
ncbi:MAG: type III polyketide synthase [Planctomycetia bacterium]|nr:type III polyketide synthase [Planctomycetia bacterium]